MVIIKEKKQLDEMARLVVSSRKDELPFRIAVQSPEHLPPHAVVLDLATGNIKLGEFVISKNVPQNPDDIKNFRKGITDEMRKLIFKWSKLNNYEFPEISNWETLNRIWKKNEKW
jgi:hypothetical protein